MSKKQDIGELYKRTALSDTEDPGDLVWEKISDDLKLNSFHDFNLLKFNIYYAAFIVIAVGGLCYLLFVKDKTETQKIPVIQNNSIKSTPIASDSLSSQMETSSKKKFSSDATISIKEIILSPSDTTKILPEKTEVSAQTSQIKDSIILPSTPVQPVKKVVIIQKDTLFEMDTIRYKKQKHLKKMLKEQK